MNCRKLLESVASAGRSATDDGLITDAILKRARLVAMGETGLIISTQMSVHPEGRTRRKQLGIHSDAMIPGLRKLAYTIHEHDAKTVFQLGHAGVQGPVGGGPSGPRQMDEAAIHEVIAAFAAAAMRAAEAGADGVQVHAAHGYLVSEFLSPFYNKRVDAWGGSEEGCFRLLKEIITEIRRVLPSHMVLMVKLNGCDFTPVEGITPPLAARYAGRLAALGVDALEVSGGTKHDFPHHRLQRPWIAESAALYTGTANGSAVCCRTQSPPCGCDAVLSPA